TSTATGLATFTGGIAVAGTSSVTGGITFDGTTSFTGALNVGATTATGVYTGTGISVSGTVTASGSALTSDRRYKKDITRLSSALDDVMKIRGVSYNWRRSEFPTYAFDNNTHYGFIAQEVEEVIPELVGTDELGMKSIRYLGFTPVLLEAMKEQQEEILILKEELRLTNSKLDLMLAFLCKNEMLRASDSEEEIESLCSDLNNREV
ncbi:hypothetical protein TrLO_g1152, partial [Triparma laevis f. longispina]